MILHSYAGSSIMIHVYIAHFLSTYWGSLTVDKRTTTTWYNAHKVCELLLISGPTSSVAFEKVVTIVTLLLFFKRLKFWNRVWPIQNWGGCSFSPKPPYNFTFAQLKRWGWHTYRKWKMVKCRGRHCKIVQWPYLKNMVCGLKFGDRFQYAFFSKSHLRTSTIQFRETSMILIVLPSLPPKKCSFRAVKENLSFCRQLPVMPLISHKNYFQC